MREFKLIFEYYLNSPYVYVESNKLNGEVICGKFINNNLPNEVTLEAIKLWEENVGTKFTALPVLKNEMFLKLNKLKWVKKNSEEELPTSSNWWKSGWHKIDYGKIRIQ